MSVRKTISDSKGFFHNDFPYVIPSIYRKIVDEYLVELNLLSNQTKFNLDGFFSFGLLKSFDVFTQGYQPPDHKDLIAIEEAHAQWMKDHPDWTDEDAADYYTQLQIDIARGKEDCEVY